MNRDRLQQIEELYHSAQAHDLDRRAAFLAGACGDDAELLQEVESLLAYQGGNGPLDRPAWQGAETLLELTVTQIVPGAQFGPYKIESPLGAGGMGKVFRGRDTRLGRAVAIKVVDEKFSERFEREARAIAALNHPHICTLYDVGPNYLVMEVCEGETLAARLRRGKLSMQDTVHYGAQIASALSAAHAKGIVHRDLKPGNIMISKSGVKVLDFGLAKTQHDATITATNVVTGTPAYMAPEQREGKVCDARTDTYSLGLVLYEMASGKRAEQGQPPPVEHLPENLAHVIGLCIAQEPEDRWQSSADLCRELQWIEDRGAEPATPSHAVARGKLREKLLWGAAAALAGGLALLAFLYFREAPPARAVPLRFQIQLPQNATAAPKLSPDGRKLAFLSGSRLWVHFLESGESRDLMAAVGGKPFWSPDSRFIAFPSEGKLKKIEVTGGSPQTVTDVPSNSWGGGAWNQDDVIVFCDGRVGSFRVPASGGVPVQIAALDSARHENSQGGPSFLPDGRHFVYLRSSTDEGKSAIYLGSLDARPEKQSSKALVASNAQPVYVPSTDPGTGYLLFVRGLTLMAQPFDNRRLELKGQAAPVAEFGKNDSGGPTYVSFSASADAVLVQRAYSLGNQLTWADREGKVMGTVGESAGYFAGVRLSPDGTRLAVSTHQAGDAANLWLLDLSRGGASTRFTFGPTVDINPVWSPDGSRMIFNSNRDGPYDLYQKPVNGEKGEEVLLKSGDNKTATSWSRDGRFLLYTVMVRSKTKNDVWVLPLGNDKKPVPFLSTEFNESQAHFSPDDHWVAYTSDESGQAEVYVRSFSMNSAGTAVEAGGKWQISNGFGVEPRWRGDGRELYYRSLDGRHMAVEIATNPAFRVGSPKPVGPLTVASWDAAADGRRFLFISDTSGPASYTVVLNWQAGLKKQAPSPY